MAAPAKPPPPLWSALTSQSLERGSGRRLREHDAPEDRGAAGEAHRTDTVARKEVAGEPGEDRLQREDDRDPGGADLPLRPDLDQVGERDGEEARDEQCRPDGPAVRH